jgi:hypothetical protein
MTAPKSAIKTFWIDSETVSIPNSLSFSLRHASRFSWVAVIMGISKEAEMVACLTMFTGIDSILAKRTIKNDVIWEMSDQRTFAPNTIGGNTPCHERQPLHPLLYWGS